MKANHIMTAGYICVVVAAGCGDTTSDTGAIVPENTGKSCTAPAQCFPGVDQSTLSDVAVCLDKVTGGYCTHKCKTDADCCAVKGERDTNLKQVCAPFESTGDMYCFLSCEAADLTGAGGGTAPDSGVYCATYAHASFGCRSTGGGSKNRKVCVP